MEHRFFRYVLPHKAPANKELLYFPYWRFKGMLFSCLPGGIQNRFLDISRQAVDTPLFPVSVGLRSQAMKLRFVSPETEGWFFRATLPFDQMLQTFLDQLNKNLPRPLLHQAHIGESLSMLYAPFYVERTVVDAILNRPVPGGNEAFDLSEFSGGPADWRIRFLPALCPNCGWDMDGRRDALVLHCRNCESMWRATKQGMTRIKVASMPDPGNEKHIYLPFWRIQAEVHGLSLTTYTDLVKAANLPKVPQPKWDRMPFYFWGPAFKVRPRSFLRLTRQVTLCQPQERLKADIPKGEKHPVNLPLSESTETLKLNLANFLKPKQRVVDRIGNIRIHPKRFLLAYLPFSERHHDLVQTDFNIAVNRNQLALAGNL